MKKLIRILVIVLTIICTIPLSDTHHHHVAEAYTEGDLYGKCAYCGNKTYIMMIETQPTCTKKGLFLVKCTVCEEQAVLEVPALGHKYKSSVTKKATCTESGIETYKCSRCGKSYTQTIAALGHKYKYEETEPDCVNDGHKIGTCKRCGDVKEEIYPALGHDMSEFTVVTEPTCEQDGLEESVCSRCGEKISQAIEKLGHQYPEEWTIEKQPGIAKTGLKTKTCERCGNVISETIPATVKPGTLIGTIVGCGILAITLYAFLKRRVPKIEKKGFDPSFENKTVMTVTEDKELVDLLKSRTYLSVKAGEKDALAEGVEEDEPHLVIIDVKTVKELDELLELKQEKFPDTALGLIVGKRLLNSRKDKLNELKKDETIVDYVVTGTKPYNTLVKLVLPVMKPEAGSDETLGNIGKIADLLGIPGVSTVINFYTSGRDIKATLEEGELGISEQATIIGDIASILGLEKLESVAGLVGDVEDIAGAFDKDRGAHEVKSATEAAQDIHDVVKDIIS